MFLASAFDFDVSSRTTVVFSGMRGEVEPCVCDPTLDRGGVSRLVAFLADLRLRGPGVVEVFEVGERSAPKDRGAAFGVYNRDFLDAVLGGAGVQAVAAGADVGALIPSEGKGAHRFELQSEPFFRYRVGGVEVLPLSTDPAFVTVLSTDMSGALVVRMVLLDRAVRKDEATEAGLLEYKAGLALLEHEKTAAPASGRSYLSGHRCGFCHKPERAFWRTTHHASAYETLVKSGNSEDPNCVPCHTTGYAGVRGAHLADRSRMTPLRNVQCEACHGPGSEHLNTMRRAAWPDTANISREVPAKVCIRCHTTENSPRFDYEVYLSKVLGPGHRATDGKAYP